MNNQMLQWLAGRAATVFGARIAHKLGITLCWVNCRDFTNARTPPTTVLQGLRIAQASLAECTTAAGDKTLDLSPGFVELAVAQGNVCHAVWDAGQMVAYAWRAERCAPHDDAFYVRVPPRCSYGYKAFTLPSYRGRGLYPLIAVAEAQTMLAMGVSQGVSFTQCANMASIRADRKFGNRIVGLAGYCRWGQWRLSFASPKVKALGFAFVRRQ